MPPTELFSNPNKKNDAVAIANRQICLLKNQLVETKFELTTAKNTQDCLMRDLFKMKMELENSKRENEDLRNQLENSNISTNDANLRNPPTKYYQALPQGSPDNQDTVGMPRQHPSCGSGIAFLSGNIDLSMESLCSLVSNHSRDSRSSRGTISRSSRALGIVPSCSNRSGLGRSNSILAGAAERNIYSRGTLVSSTQSRYESNAAWNDFSLKR